MNHRLYLTTAVSCHIDIRLNVIPAIPAYNWHFAVQYCYIFVRLDEAITKNFWS